MPQSNIILSLQEEELQASEREKQTVTQQLTQKDADLATTQHQLRVKVCEYIIALLDPIKYFLPLQEEKLQESEREKQMVTQKLKRKETDLVKAQHQLTVKVCQCLKHVWQ